MEIGRLSGDDDELAEAPQKTDSNGGRLGLVVDSLDKEMKKNWQLSGGVVVQQVIPGGPGAKAGLAPGDVIAQLGFTQIDSVSAYKKAEEAMPGNSLLPIRFFRRGRPAFRTITIEE